MASEYGYITITILEDYTGIDYSATDAVAFHDDNVNLKISIAERMVNGYLGVSTGQTATDAIKSCVTIIAAGLLHTNMKILGYGLEGDSYEYKDPLSVLEFFLKGDQDVMVDSIPMSGASYHKPDSRLFL